MSELTALISLDSTEFSESALLMLPLLKEIGFDTIRLVSVANPKKNINGDNLTNYLKQKASKVEGLGFECQTRVLDGDPANAILAEADSPDVDLIVVATHGRTGIARLRLGSVGEKLIKNASCPRLVIGPNVEVDLATYDLTHVLVPLDGSEKSEMSLPIARYLAKVCHAQVDLIRSVSPSVVGGGEVMHIDMVGLALDEANGYLNQISDRFEGLDVSVTVVNGRPDQTIIEHMKNTTNDLVVMVSNGRTGFLRAFLGSTTESVLRGPDPVLVFEPGEDHSRLFEAARADFN